MMEVKDVRLNNLKLVMDRGRLTQAELAIKCDLAPSLISQIMTKRRNMGAALARKLEEKLKLDDGWFDFPHDLVDTTVQMVKSEWKPKAFESSLTKREIRLLELFRQMPESEKMNIIIELDKKKREYDKLLDELIALKSEQFSKDNTENNNENNE